MTAPSPSPLVLLVDDVADAREMTAELLELEGFRTAQAASGTEALDQAFSLKPDIILMDLSLPGMDGWEATRRLKADARTKAIPVVCLTGHTLELVPGRGEARWDLLLKKPCAPDTLIHEIKRALAQA